MPIYVDRKTSRLYIQFQYKGVRIKERLPAGTSKKDAEKIEVKIKNDLMFQKHGIDTEQSIVTFKHFVESVYSPASDHFNQDRLDRTVLIIKAAYALFRDKPMRSIKAADLERLKAARASLPTMHGTIRKPATIEREMSIISSIFKMAVDNDVIDYNPCSRVKKLSFDNVQDKVLKREDEDAFFTNMFSEWAKDICRMVLNTGLRQNDLMRLTRFQIDREQRIITLIQGKTKRRVIIPLNQQSMEIINRRWSSDLLFPSPVTGKETGSVRHAMQRACGRAEIPVITIRDLRRTFATRALEDGADYATIADILGHSDLRMLSRYVRSLESKRKLVDSISKFPTIAPLPKLINRKLLTLKG